MNKTLLILTAAAVVAAVPVVQAEEAYMSVRMRRQQISRAQKRHGICVGQAGGYDGHNK